MVYILVLILFIFILSHETLSTVQNNPMGEDYLASHSPFVTKDVTSKSAQLGLGGAHKGNALPSGFYWTQRNPNAVRKNTGNRKK